MTIRVCTKEEKIRLEKPRFNTHAYGHGVITSEKEKQNNRRFKRSQTEKKRLKEYSYFDVK